MNEENTSKTSARTTGEDALRRTLDLIRAMWIDYHDGRWTWEHCPVAEYTARYGVQKFPKNIIAPVLLRASEPGEQEAAEFRLALNSYRYSLRDKPAEAVRQENLDERTAIALLRKKGYRIMKKTVAYIDID